MFYTMSQLSLEFRLYLCICSVLLTGYLLQLGMYIIVIAPNDSINWYKQHSNSLFRPNAEFALDCQATHTMWNTFQPTAFITWDQVLFLWLLPFKMGIFYQNLCKLLMCSFFHLTRKLVTFLNDNTCRTALCQIKCFNFYCLMYVNSEIK